MIDKFSQFAFLFAFFFILAFFLFLIIKFPLFYFSPYMYLQSESPEFIRYCINTRPPEFSKDEVGRCIDVFDTMDWIDAAVVAGLIGSFITFRHIIKTE